MDIENSKKAAVTTKKSVTAITINTSSSGGIQSSASPVSVDGARSPLRQAQVEGDQFHNRDNNERFLLLANITYLLTIGVSGLVLCALGSNLSDIAAEVRVDTRELGGWAFMARGVGSILGALLSSKIFQWIQGDRILMCGLTVIAGVLALIPSSSSDKQLYIYFFILGLCSAINDTGCNILVRRLRGKQAGPWLGANGISFGMSAAVVPIIELISDDFATQYYILAFTILAVAFSVLLNICLILPRAKVAAENSSDLLSGDNSKYDIKDNSDHKAPHYFVELFIAVMLFCFVGGQVDTVAYITPYVIHTKNVPNRAAGEVLTIFWVFVTIGRLIGVWDQRSISNDNLVRHLSICCILGSASMLLIVAYPSSPRLLWAGIAVYALTYGPTVGYCHDLNNRLTLPTEQSSSICMFGLNCGASFVPFLTAKAWQYFGNNPVTLMVAILLSMLLPIPLLHFTQRLSYTSTNYK